MTNINLDLIKRTFISFFSNQTKDFTKTHVNTAMYSLINSDNTEIIPTRRIVKNKDEIIHKRVINDYFQNRCHTSFVEI